MAGIWFRAAMLGTVLAVAGCAASPPEARVTRFHLNQPIAPGAIAIEPRNAMAANELEFQAYAGAVAQELSRIGYRIAPGVTKSELVAVVDVRRMSRQIGPEQSPVSIGIGGGTFGGNVGVGGGVSFPVGKARGSYATATELSVQIKRRSEGTVIWEGRAEAIARDGTPYAEPAAAVGRLAGALFKDFPGESGRTITVK
jgi:hypothetical protein